MHACGLSHVWLCDPVDFYSLPGSSVRGMFQARILEQVAISFSRGSSPNPGIEPMSPASPALAVMFFISWVTSKPCSANSALFTLFPSSLQQGTLFHIGKTGVSCIDSTNSTLESCLGKLSAKVTHRTSVKTQLGCLFSDSRPLFSPVWPMQKSNGCQRMTLKYYKHSHSDL